MKTNSFADYQWKNILSGIFVLFLLYLTSLYNYLLFKNEEKFRLAFRTSPDAINLNTLGDGVYIDINEGFTKIMGYSREEVIGEPSIELNIWNDLNDRERLISGLNKHGFVENLEADFKGKYGQIKTDLMSARVVSIDNKDTILSITRDITEKREAEEALKKSEEELQSIFRAAPFRYHQVAGQVF